MEFLWYRRVGFIPIVDGRNQNARRSLCLPRRLAAARIAMNPSEKLEGQFAHSYLETGARWTGGDRSEGNVWVDRESGWQLSAVFEPLAHNPSPMTALTGCGSPPSQKARHISVNLMRLIRPSRPLRRLAACLSPML
jgi:hypothetical protein